MSNKRKHLERGAYQDKYDECIEAGQSEDEAEKAASAAAEDAWADYGDWCYEQEKDRRMMEGSERPKGCE